MAERFIQSIQTQKTFYRAVQELSNELQYDGICIIIQQETFIEMKAPLFPKSERNVVKIVEIKTTDSSFSPIDTEASRLQGDDRS